MRIGNVRRRACRRTHFASNLSWGLLLLGILVSVWTLASCAGGHRPPVPPKHEQPPPPPPPPAPEELTEYENAVAGRIQPWPSSDKGAVKGTLAVEGLTILDRQTLQPASPSDRLSEIITRIVDPEDNIGSIENPDPSGDFLHPDLDPSDFARLQVEFLVAEDIDADGSGGDAVQVELPVSIAAGVETAVDLALSGTSLEQFGSPHIPPDLGPVEGVPIKLTYHVLDPRGERDALLGLMLNLRQLAVDRDGNGAFDRDDPVEPDTDRNAFGDTSQEDFIAGARMSPPVELSFEGRITEIADGRLRVFDADAHRMRLVRLNFHVSVLAGLDGRPLRLTPALVGRNVFVHALALPEDRIMALLVLVLEE